MIKFSIITVCLNAGNDLLETVESTLKQSYDEFEIIVKDGFSKDCSIEKLPQNKKVCVYQEKDKSVYDAMNQAIAYATGDYCLFINAGDTLYEPSTLQLIADFIEKNPGDFYYGKSHTLKQTRTMTEMSMRERVFLFTLISFILWLRILRWRIFTGRSQRVNSVRS